MSVILNKEYLLSIRISSAGSVPNFNLISALCTDFFLEIMSEILSEWIGFVESIIQKGTGRI